jgi:hypothetical protein
MDKICKIFFYYKEVLAINEKQQWDEYKQNNNKVLGGIYRQVLSLETTSNHR